jgi:hypothetical protein
MIGSSEYLAYMLAIYGDVYYLLAVGYGSFLESLDVSGGNHGRYRTIAYRL